MEGKPKPEEATKYNSVVNGCAMIFLFVFLIWMI